MTRREVTDLLEVVRMLWPQSNLGDNPEAQVGAWAMVLADASTGAVEQAVTRLARAGLEHAPTVSTIYAEAARVTALPAPGFDEAQAWLARHISAVRPAFEGEPEDTPAAIEALTYAGAHEAVLRFVAEHGIAAIRRLPDGTRYALDPNQQADRRDFARDYKHRTLRDYERDPRPGVALERAYAAAGIDPRERPVIVAASPAELRARRTARPVALPAVDPEPEAMADPADVAAEIDRARRAMRATGSEKRERERRAADAARGERAAELEAARRELREHNARRDSESATDG